MEPPQNHSENTAKTRNQGTTANSHIGQWAHTGGSIAVKLQ